MYLDENCGHVEDEPRYPRFPTDIDHVASARRYVCACFLSSGRTDASIGTLYFLALLMLNVVTLVLDSIPNGSVKDGNPSLFILVNEAYVHSSFSR